MKYLFCFLANFLFLTHACYCQRNEAANVFDKIKIEFVEFKSKTQQPVSALPFSNIKVIDKRYDTFCMGYMKYGSKLIQQTKIDYQK